MENVTQLTLFLAYRESLSAPFILVTASASLVLTANLTILWEPLCMDPQHPQQVMCQLCATNWHPHQGIQKDCLTGVLEGRTGFPNLIPSIYPLGMEMMRERHRKPYSVFLHAASHSWLFSNYISQHIRKAEAVQVLIHPFAALLRFPQTVASSCLSLTFTQEKVLARPFDAQLPIEINRVTIPIYLYQYIQTQDTLTCWHWVLRMMCLDPFVVVYTGDVEVDKAYRTNCTWIQHLFPSLFLFFPFSAFGGGVMVMVGLTAYSSLLVLNSRNNTLLPYNNSHLCITHWITCSIRGPASVAPSEKLISPWGNYLFNKRYRQVSCNLRNWFHHDFCLPIC